jgi:RHS repeat-associated protein
MISLRIRPIYLLSIVFFVSTFQLAAQYQITGNTCVLSGPYYGPYTITGGSWSTADKWCVSGGTINVTGNSCIFNNGAPSIGVTWNAGVTTGSISYFHNGTGAPVATLAVSVIDNTISNPQGNPASSFPFVSSGVPVLLSISGSDVANACNNSNVSYSWQLSTDNINFTTISGAIGKDYLLHSSFTQTTYYRRVAGFGGYFSNSNSVQVVPVAPINTGIITPAYLSIKAGTVPVAGAFTASASSGGAMCGSGSYAYEWQTSTDNINWTTIISGSGNGASSFAPSTPVTMKTYIRQVLGCGPMKVATNIAILDINKLLNGGLVSPVSITILGNTDPGTLTCNPASNGNVAAGYTYRWQQSIDDGNTYNDIPGPGAGFLNYSPGNINVPTRFRRKVICDAETAYSSAAMISIGVIGTNQNYIRTRELNHGGITTLTAANALTALEDVKQTTVYYDDLGRAIETVMKQGSMISNTAPTDLVSVIQYDMAGLQTFAYLPYVSTAGDGNFKVNAMTEQRAYNNVKFPGEDFFYSQTNYELSPLYRLNSNTAAGLNWTGNNRGLQKKYERNTLADLVRTWYVANSNVGSFASYNTPGIYLAGTLTKDMVLDENGNQVITFTDRSGNLILKKVQLTATPDEGSGTGYTGWLCTYYIYDDLNNLRCVIQPKGTELLLQNNWNITALSGVILNEQCFRYEYDSRKRLIMTKLPGAGEVYMVYDSRDRMVMTQDANMRNANTWQVTLYEGVLNRPEQTGKLLNTWNNNTFVQHLAAASSSTTYPFTSSTVPASTYWDSYTRTGYDNYAGVPGASGLTSTLDASWSAQFNSTFNSSPLYAQQQSSTAQVKGFVTWKETKVLETTTYLYSLNIYDDNSRLLQTKSKNLTTGTDVNTVQYNWIGQPLITVEKTEKAGGTQPQTTVVVLKHSYDNLGRITQTERKLSNTLLNGNAMSAYVVTSSTEYDAVGQLTKTSFGSKKDPVTNLYHVPRQPLQEMTYDYNIRGWILGMNRNYLLAQGQTTDGVNFGFELGYDKTANNTARNFIAQQWNGNITGVVWKSDGDDIRRKYDYAYDAAGRILKADFEQQNDDDNQWNNVKVNFNVGGDIATGGNIKYDANGNILEMWQKGLKITGSDWIDKLTYAYYIGTNKLQKVTDLVTANNQLGDFTDKNAAGDDYGYDKNGNLVTDLNKKMNGSTGLDLTFGGATVYNYLNRVQEIPIKDDNNVNRGKITYLSDTEGKKLKKIVEEFPLPANNNIATTTTTLYLGSIVFESKTDNNAQTIDHTDKLQFVGSSEGRIRAVYDNPADPNILTGLENDYFIKDHLGNVRVVLTEQVQKSIYPPATLEGSTSVGVKSMVNWEKQFYTVSNDNNIATTNATNMPGWSSPSMDYPNNNGDPFPDQRYPADHTVNGNATSQKMYKLNAASNKTDLAFVIKVMAGDKIDIFGKSYYHAPGQTFNNGNSSSLILSNIINAFLGTPGNPATAKGVTQPQMEGWNSGVGGIPGSFIRGSNGESSSTPKAYINFIFFDEQFRYAGKSGASRVGGSGSVKDHYTTDLALQNIAATKNGYLYVYLSNESNTNVFFDNLQVMHNRGPVLQETHYYPFGLVMSGISSNALAFGNPQNRKKFNGIEHTTEFDLNTYDAFYRNEDPQIGRWWQIDPRPSYDGSPYAVMGNNPILQMDPLGDTVRFGRTRNGDYIINGQVVKGKALAQKVLDDWSAIGGVKLKLKKNGEVKFRGYVKGSNHSSTGRTEVMKMVTGNGQVEIEFDSKKESQTTGNTISLNPTQITDFINGTSSDLDSRTSGFGMVTLHEFHHTTAGGGFGHSEATVSSWGIIDKPDQVGNQIRKEMSEVTGTKWGQRSSYASMTIKGQMYYSFSTANNHLLKVAAWRGNISWQNYFLNPPPTTDVIKVPFRFNEP